MHEYTKHEDITFMKSMWNMFLIRKPNSPSEELFLRFQKEWIYLEEQILSSSIEFLS
jgi:hypothetical protein